ncbi:uncharacterized protein BKA78DRAFT_321942 [Phyllosticta capitalensis]|uniref:uncharacterized protein n=1 Tax=Phyllosticta capitalensis TaxID=121624 RepID=UPI00312DAFC1
MRTASRSTPRKARDLPARPPHYTGSCPTATLVAARCSAKRCADCPSCRTRASQYAGPPPDLLRRG